VISLALAVLAPVQATAQPARRKGESVEVKFTPEDKWEKCSIVDIQPGKYLVQKRTDFRFKQWITEAQIRDPKAEREKADAEWKAAKEADDAKVAKTARDTIAVGDIVEVRPPAENRWQRAKVLEVKPGEVLVQYGGRYDKATYKLEALRDPAAEAQAGKSRELMEELKPYYGTISNLASTFDPNLRGNEGNGAFQQSALPKYRKELPEIRKICEKYGEVPNLPLRGDPANIFNRPIEVCALARSDVDALAKKVRAAQIQETMSWNGNNVVKAMDAAMTVAGTQISDSLQRCVFDHPAWVAEQDKFYEKEFGKLENLSADRYAAVEAKVADLKAFIDKEGTTKTFEMPPYRDATLEGMVKSQVAAQYKGASVLKIGSDYNTWVAYDEKTWVKSDATYDYFRVEKGKNQYKRGWFLVKLPGRPYCQAREWIAARVNTGAPRVDYIAPAGLFMKCQ